MDKEIVAHIVKLKSGKQAMNEDSVNVYRTVENVKYEEIKPFTIAKISDHPKKSRKFGTKSVHVIANGII